MNDKPPVNQDTWQNLFAPATVAVIGASNTAGSWGNNAIRGLLKSPERRIFPVNPNAPEVVGIKAYRSVTEIPEPVDLAVIVVAEKLVPAVMRECVTKGVKAAVIITSGFGEMGEEGRKLEAEVADIARRGGVRFIGPNSMGHADTRSQLSTFGQFGEMPRGQVAVLAQSGSTCLKIARNLNESGIPLSKYISTGNEADLTMEDYLEYLADDEVTKIIALYIEGLRDGRRFFNLAQKITRKKPIVAVKVGGTEESAKAVMSHTGALAGTDAVYTAAFKQSGVIRVEDDDELCDVVFALLNSPLPRGNRVGILSIGGGPGALAAESCEKEGLAIGKLDPATVTKLDGLLSSRWPRRNPVDMAGPSAAEISVVASLLWPLMDDKNLDFIFLLAPIIMDKTYLTGRLGLSPEAVKAYREKEEKNVLLIREKVQQLEKPVVMMWQWRGSSDPEVNALFQKGRFIVCSNARRAARVLRYLVVYRQYLDAVGK
ncbi:MAG: CoA-binding protein [Dehalococcoidales bacterium]